MQLFNHASKLQARWVTTRAQVLLPPHLATCINSSRNSSRNSSSLSPSSVPQLLHAQVQPFSCCSSSRRWQHSVVAAAAAATAAAEAAAAGGDAAAAGEQQLAGDWTVLNFYHLVDIADPEEVSSPAVLLCVTVCTHSGLVRFSFAKHKQNSLSMAM
jgi:hypothetical protein